MFFLRIGFLFQAAFWIVLVSFLLTGGDYERARHARGFAAPARQTAGLVVETVLSLRNVCDDHEDLCDKARHTGRTIGHWTKTVTEEFSGAWDWSRDRFKRLARKD